MDDRNTAGRAPDSASPLRRLGRLRQSERVLVVYFLYAAVVAWMLPIPPLIATAAMIVNLAIVAAYLLVAYIGERWRSPVLAYARDWAPLVLIVLAYRQMGWFAPSQHSYELEHRWVVWDRLLLNDWGLRHATESLGAILPTLLELSYLMVYAIGPFCVVALYLDSKQQHVDRFLLTFTLGTLLSYALFPYFPSEPPRAVFPGDLFPNVDSVVRRLNWGVLGSQGIHTSVFPSGHVSAAFAAAFAMMRILPERKWLGRGLLVVAAFIFWATIYGRYHYAVDALAGLGIAAVALAITLIAERFGAASDRRMDPGRGIAR